MEPTQQSQRHVQAVMAALEILDCFEREASLSLKRLIELTGQTRNRIMRLAGTLEECGYLVRGRDDGEYRLGPKLMVLGKVYEHSHDLVRLARPILRDLSRETGESASLYVIDGLERRVLVRQEGTHDVRYTVTEGQRLPLHAGASGKVLLAFGPESLWREVSDRERLEPLTPETKTRLQDLARELDKVRLAGLAQSYAERVPDAASLAAPVFNHRRELVGAISIAGPVSRMSAWEKADFASKVVAAARELSQLLGDSPSG